MDVRKPGPGSSLDTIVIGGSAGAFRTLKRALEALPASLPAAVFVVLHTDPHSEVATHEVLGSGCSLPVRLASDDQPIEPGTVTLAPRDAHLMLGEEHVHVRRGPRENGFRPSIDVLFRSAGVYRGPRAAGFILPGFLDDGAAGLFTLAKAGGQPFVQAPADTDFPDMPAAALNLVPEATIFGAEQLAAEIEAIAGVRVQDPGPLDDSALLELSIAGLECATMADVRQLGSLSPYNCPDCSGVLWEIDEGGARRYRCHTGHAYSEASLDKAQDEALERRLFDALRAHRGRADMLFGMHERATGDAARQRLKSRAESFRQDALLLEDIIRRRKSAP